MHYGSFLVVDDHPATTTCVHMIRHFPVSSFDPDMQANVSCNFAACVHDECVCDVHGAVLEGCGERDEETVRED